MQNFQVFASDVKGHVEIRVPARVSTFSPPMRTPSIMSRTRRTTPPTRTTRISSTSERESSGTGTTSTAPRTRRSARGPCRSETLTLWVGSRTLTSRITTTSQPDQRTDKVASTVALSVLCFRYCVPLCKLRHHLSQYSPISARNELRIERPI